MKLLTLNVHAWLEENQLEKINILAEQIAKESYDVVALQEVNQLITSKIVYGDIKEDNYGYILLKKINELSKEKYSYYWSNSHIGYDRYDEGIALLTKHKVLNTDNFYCTTIKNIESIESRKIVSVKIEYCNDEIEFYSCHMNLPTSKIENIYDNLNVIVNRTSNENLKFFLGDFNTDGINNKEDYEKLLKYNLIDTYCIANSKDDGITVLNNIHGWEKNTQQKRLDYIFSNKLIDVEYSRVIFNDKNLPIISDHNGVEIKVNL